MSNNVFENSPDFTDKKEEVETELKFQEIKPEYFIAQRDQLPLSLRAFLTPYSKMII